MKPQIFAPDQNIPGPSISTNGRRVLEARYLKRGTAGAIVESPEEMFRRVACSVAAVDREYEGAEAAAASEEEFYQAMARLEFLPNSPTLMNAGRELQQLSACFVLPVEDSLHSIFEAVKNTALIHKSGGGTGFSFSNLRPKGDRVRSTQGVASGPVSFMRVFDAATEAVKQGGTRRGANMGVLRVDHPDILDFIDSKSDRTALKNFNISVAVNSHFMESAAAGRDYVLVHPKSGKPWGHLNAREVLRQICLRAWQTGDPGMLFLDRINQGNPTPEVGYLSSTNPCGEQPLLPYESCTLGSINLARMTKPLRGRVGVDYGRLARTARMAVRFLDNSIDASCYPLDEISRITLANRKIGLGVMGWADFLIRLGVSYDSEIALRLAGKVMGFIQRVGHRTSLELARSRGAYPNYNGKFGPGDARRNATVTTVAPTGSISIIANCSSGIEPLFALSYSRKHVLDGQQLTELHPPLLGELRRRNLSNRKALEQIIETGSLRGIAGIPPDLRKRYVTALEISPDYHVRMQAAFQEHSDSGVSKTVNLAQAASPEDVERIYSMAYYQGCKGITVYRDRCREAQVLNAGCTACA
jgi:ribonucleoside-diphosphate reductase alpha chain